MRQELDHLFTSISDIEYGFMADERGCEKHLADNLAKLTMRMSRGATKAQEAAPATLDEWFQKSKEGGIPNQTFKALCFRNGGAFVGSTGRAIDLNEKLVERIKDNVP